MPCLSDGYERTETSRHHSEASRISKLEKEKANLEAALCVALTFIEKNSNLIDLQIVSDWDESGITSEQFFSWWDNHKTEDDRRRRREKYEKELKEAEEAAERIKREKVDRILSKLTNDEKELLGIK